MARRSRNLVALDIGSRKTCVLIGAPEAAAPGGPDPIGAGEANIRLLGSGIAESRGTRRGVIVNLEMTVACIRQAVQQAEAAAGVTVESAMVGIAGTHLKSVNSRGGVSLGSRPRDITREDVRAAVDAARAVSLPEDREVIHVLPQEFLLDAQNGIRDPIGMIGSRLEANVHIVTASATATQNVVTAANRAGVLVADTVLEPLAAADACLSADEKELGVALIDIGGGTSELIVFEHGAVRHTGVIPVGGDHFSNDVAVGLRTPIPEAERIKCRYGCALFDILKEDQAIEITSVGDRPPRTVFQRALCDILGPRAQELMTLIRDELQRRSNERALGAGVVLTGGGARLHGMIEVAERILEKPVRLAIPRRLSNMPPDIEQPEYSAAVGLLLYAGRLERLEQQRHVGFGERLKKLMRGEGWN